MSLNVKGQRSRLLGTKSAVHSHHPRQRRNGTYSLQMTLRSGRRHHSVAARGWCRRPCVRCMFGKTSLALVWICFSSFCYLLTFICASCHFYSFSVQLPFSAARVCVQSKSNFCSHFCRATPCQRGIRYGLVSLVRSKSQPMDDKPPLKRRCYGHVIQLNFLGPNHIFERLKLGISNLMSALILTSTSVFVRRIDYPRKRCA